MKYINRKYFWVLGLEFWKVEIFSTKIYCEIVFWKEIKRNWNELAKIQKYFNFSNSNHAWSELKTSNINEHYHHMSDLYALDVKLFTNEVDGLRKLVS
jgi:hypothetical protein